MQSVPGVKFRAGEEDKVTVIMWCEDCVDETDEHVTIAVAKYITFQPN